MGNGDPINRPHHLLWAKLGRRAYAERHCLACHLLDAAAVAAAFVNEVLPAPGRELIRRALGGSEAAAAGWLAYWVGLHDIGKACPSFQQRDPSGEATARLTAAGFRFGRPASEPHGTVSAAVLQDLLHRPPTGVCPLSRSDACHIAAAIGGHHGLFPAPCSIGNAGSTSVLGEGAAWAAARADLLQIVATAVGITGVPAPAIQGEVCNAFLALLAGLTSVCDWIASNEDFFPAEPAPADPAGYYRRAQVQAAEALHSLGWTRSRLPASSPRSFAELFPACTAPRPLQQAVAALATDVNAGSLVLIEAPMGEGKTEAALQLVDHWLHRHHHGGLYVALPTTATSNQMFERLMSFLEQRYPSHRINLQVLHGLAALDPRFQQLQRQALYDDDSAPRGVVAEAWFAQDKRRAILAPFGVGTIDQLLLAVLQVKHGFVRLSGLAGKVIVLDEVHAYDAYMSQLIDRLLEWLRALGCSVVLLSATLPAGRRASLVQAWGSRRSLPVEARYPRITIVDDNAAARVKPVSASPDRRQQVKLRWVAAERLADALLEQVRDGGCAAILCNTVNTAQQLYRQLRGQAEGTIDIELFHARFPLRRRREIEQRVLSRYGRPGRGERPRRAILVATQVVEQSLDLDFDLMVSELAPVDLLLQRAGRLHRHQRPRPAGLEQPQLWLVEPKAGGDGLPDFGSSEYVYDRHVLLRSFVACQDRAVWVVPDDIDPLVQKVYADHFGHSDPAWQHELEATARESEARRLKDEADAARVRILSPTSDADFVEARSLDLDEDDPDAHPKLRAATRLTEPSVGVVFGFQTPGGVALGSPEGPVLDLGAAVHSEAATQILDHACTLQHRAIVASLKGQTAPIGWQSSGLLRHHRLMVLDTASSCVLERVRVRLSDDEGVVIERLQDDQEEP
jgi:CRISPR-associated endonuclease/helicase Cas3